MNEDFLHYVWQFQYFDKKDLTTTSGETLHIFQTGMRNTNAGPDFSGARIKIDSLEWNGSVELHIRSSEWERHHHQLDESYENVVLHVVWKADKAIIRKDGSIIPTLELSGRVDNQLLGRYNALMSSAKAVPCSNSLAEVPEITRWSALEKALVQRMEAKAAWVTHRLKENQGDWDETAYQVLARNFGFKINSDPFFALSQVLPYRILRKHIHQLQQVEALIFGQAGMLVAKSKDEYITALVKEYEFLKHKYSLETHVSHAHWKFLRLRPANFPTLRLAQFAKLITSSTGIFSQLVAATDFQSLQNVFQIDPSAYWKTHYRFGTKAAGVVSSFGDSSFHNVVINSVVPILVAYGKVRDDDQYVDRALKMLQQLPAEKNRITKAWMDLGQTNASAFDSQGWIELYNNFCQKHLCLNCSIGSYLVRPANGKS